MNYSYVGERKQKRWSMGENELKRGVNVVTHPCY